RLRSATRARGEHAFHVVKRLWGFTKVRYRGLAKNTARLFTMFALANLYLGRRRLLAAEGTCRCRAQKAPRCSPCRRALRTCSTYFALYDHGKWIKSSSRMLLCRASLDANAAAWANGGLMMTAAQHPHSRSQLSRRDLVLTGALAIGMAPGGRALASDSDTGISYSAEAIRQEPIVNAARHQVYRALTDAKQFDRLIALGDA